MQRCLGRGWGKSEHFSHCCGLGVALPKLLPRVKDFSLVKFSPQRRVGPDLVSLEHPGNWNFVWFCVSPGYKHRPSLRPDLPVRPFCCLSFSLLICRIFFYFCLNPRTFLAAPAPGKEAGHLGMSVGFPLYLSFFFLPCFANNLLAQYPGTQSLGKTRENCSEKVSGQISPCFSLDRTFL